MSRTLPGYHDGGVYDCPFESDEDPQYASNVLEPLERGEGVACFVVRDEDGEPTVLYCAHRLEGDAGEVARAEVDEIRVRQALAIQREAREQAAQAGFEALVG
jgi:hypothetical protein